MSVSKAWTGDPKNQAQVLELFRSPEAPSQQMIAEKLGTTHHNVMWVLRNLIPKAEFKALTAIRYSRSKTGSKNPMFGKSGEQHHAWIGACDDGNGYLTILKDGKRQYIHRIVMAEALGLLRIPEELDVHHIDGDKQNNSLDNLAVVTTKGHLHIHYLQAKDSLSVQLKKSSLTEALKYLTLP
jgi:hypothetical protein